MAGEGGQNVIANASIRVTAEGSEQVAAQLGKAEQSAGGLTRAFKSSVGAITSFIGRMGAMIGVMTTAFIAGQRLGNVIRGINQDILDADETLNKLGGGNAIKALQEEISAESRKGEMSLFERMITGDFRSDSEITKRVKSLQDQLTNAANAAAKAKADADQKALDTQIDAVRKKTAEMHKESMTATQRENYEYQQQVTELKEMESKANDAVLKQYIQNARRVAREAHEYRLVMIQDEANAALRAFEKRERAMADAIARSFEAAFDRIDQRTRSAAESAGGNFETQVVPLLSRIERRMSQLR